MSIFLCPREPTRQIIYISKSTFFPFLPLTHFERFHCVGDAKAVFAGVLRNLVKVGGNEAFLLDELDVGQRLCGEFNGLVEAVFTTVRHIDSLDDLGLQPLVKQVGLVQLRLKVSRTSENEASDVNLCGSGKRKGGG